MKVRIYIKNKHLKYRENTKRVFDIEGLPDCIRHQDVEYVAECFFKACRNYCLYTIDLIQFGFREKGYIAIYLTK